MGWVWSFRVRMQVELFPRCLALREPKILASLIETWFNISHGRSVISLLQPHRHENIIVCL